uniref:Uncharacterized protein n=1 Tax=Arundo donax TaxID=35708 RepID=A0A0A9ED52_ARUDO
MRSKRLWIKQKYELKEKLRIW